MSGSLRWLLVALVVVVAATQMNIQAAEPGGDAAPDQASSQTKKTQTEPSPKPEGPTPEEFDPSENISEDFAVAFPVDI
ncbi:MAG: hypothetical protein O3A63_08060 [Proteobacteria bacterium]|nr:hypothetical protein [Pseudomonadota bacterium]